MPSKLVSFVDFLPKQSDADSEICVETHFLEKIRKTLNLKGKKLASSILNVVKRTFRKIYERH